MRSGECCEASGDKTATIRKLDAQTQQITFIKGNNFQLESLSKEIIPYWKSHFINPVISKKWKTGGDYKKLAKDLEKETENAVKGKVIKMPSQRRQNQEELYNFNVN